MKVGFPGMTPFSIARTAFRSPDIPAEHSECPMLLLIWRNPKELAGPISKMGMSFLLRDRLKGEGELDFTEPITRGSRRIAQRTEEAASTSTGSPACQISITERVAARLTIPSLWHTYLSACSVTFEVAGSSKIRNASISIGSLYSGCLSLNGWTCNPRRPSITVRGRSPNHSSDRIAVSDCIFQPFQQHCVDSLGLDVAIGLGIKRVAFARGRKRLPHCASCVWSANQSQNWGLGCLQSMLCSGLKHVNLLTFLN
jgi:hypothetical protein